MIILVNFKDVKFASSNNKQAFANLLNLKGYSANGGTGSARDYFMDNSDGRFTPVFNVFGPVELLENRDFYGGNDKDGNDKNPTQMVIDACMLAKNLFGVNFADYDHDNDGEVDNVFIFYAGKGENDGGGKDAIWPHQSFIGNRNFKLDGVLINSYACSSELRGNGSMSGIGVFVHEFGHVLGLPDFYDADYEQNGQGSGIGRWSVMDSGNYLNNGNTPPNHIAKERFMLGWLTPTILNPIEAGRNHSIEPISSNQAYIIHTPTINEYFLIENRKIGDKWDKYIPGEGMLVYHIDKTTSANKDIDYYGEKYTVSSYELWVNGIPNIIKDHQCFDLLRANNNPANYAGMPFSTGNSLTDNTTPNLKAWNGLLSGAAITNINTSSSTTSFRLTRTSSPAPIRAPYSEDFANTPNYWTAFGKNSSNISWYFLNSNDISQKNGLAVIEGKNNTANDWLVTPQIYIPAGSSSVNLKFQVTYFSNEKLEIKVSDTNLEETSFETIGTYNLIPNKINNDNKSYGSQTISLPLNKFIGKNTYIAFVNKSVNAIQLQMTNISVSGNIPKGIKENSINSPFAFSNGKTVYFENITGNILLNIYDIKGNRYVSKSIYESGSQEIAVPGIYIVKLQTNNDVFTYKIIIE